MSGRIDVAERFDCYKTLRLGRVETPPHPLTELRSANDLSPRAGRGLETSRLVAAIRPT